MNNNLIIFNVNPWHGVPVEEDGNLEPLKLRTYNRAKMKVLKPSLQYQWSSEELRIYPPSPANAGPHREIRGPGTNF